MFEFVSFIRSAIYGIYNTLDQVYFTVLDSMGVNLNVSLADLLVGLICMGLIISVFWKGARA